MSVSSARWSQEAELLSAAQCDDTARARALVASGVSVNCRDATDRTPLALAVQYGYWDMARFLVESGADVNAVGRFGVTPLITAVDESRAAMVQWLVDAGADVNAALRNGNTVLMHAVQVRTPLAEVVRCLLARGADANAMLKNGETLLAHLARRGMLGAVQALVEGGVIVNASSRDGKTPVMAAAQSGEWAVVRSLVESGANKSTVLENGEALLDRAAKRGKWDVVMSLLDDGAGVNAVDQVVQVLSDRCEVVRCSGGSSGTAVNTVLDNGDTLLLCAAKQANWGAVKFLIDGGADANATDVLRQTALMYAAQRGELEIVRRLLDCGVDANAVNHNGQTAFFLAASNGHLAVQRLLMPYTRRSQNQDGEAMSSSSESESRSWFISPFEISLQEYVNAQSVGGEYRARWLDADVVLKLFVPVASGTTFAEEVTVWHQLRHPNVIKLYGACDLGHHFFVCEFASNGSLVEHLAHADAQRTPWKFLYEAALGLAYLHERKIVHGNLRGSNILVGSDGVANLAEFGLSGSAKVQRWGNSSGSLLGSERWQSPEHLKGDQASFASDIYSLGLCIVEAHTGQIPWSGERDKQIIYAKEYWIPASESGYLAPAALTKELRYLTARMCA